MEGRRVERPGDLDEPGDYCVDYAEDDGVRIAGLWFIMPTGRHGFVAAEGFGRIKDDGEIEPEWAITVVEEGKVTVDPSIHCIDHWHGYLKAGVWSEA